MKNFIFKSNASDLQKMFSILENLQKNIVYITYKVDNIIKLVKSLNVDTGLQKQVDQYFEQDQFGSAYAKSVKDNQNDIPEDSDGNRPD